jgi:hypothetical protein
MIKQGEKSGLPATDSGPKPGDFPLGSPQSRAAARMLMERVADEERVEMIFSGSVISLESQQRPPSASEWTRGADGVLRRTVFIPNPDMSLVEALRMVGGYTKEELAFIEAERPGAAGYDIRIFRRGKRRP